MDFANIDIKKIANIIDIIKECKDAKAEYFSYWW